MIPPGARRSLFAVSGTLGFTVIAAGVALLICADPFLSSVVPRRWWPEAAEMLPYKLTALLALVALVGHTVVRLTARLHLDEVLIVAIAACTQLGGLKAGIIGPLDLVTAGILLVIVAQRLLNPRMQLQVPAVVAFGALLILLALPHLIHQQPARYVLGVLALAKVVLLAFVFVNLVTDQARLRFALRALLTVAALSATVAIAQSALHSFAGVSFSLIDDFAAGDDTEVKDTLAGVTMRASGLNATPQHLATFLVLLLPFLLFRLASPSDSALWRRSVLVLSVLAGIVLTWNNVSLMVLAVVLVIFPLARWPRYALQYGALVALAGGGLYAAGTIDWAYGVVFEGHGSVSKGLLQRLSLLEMGFNRVASDPLVGEGLRGFASSSGNFWGRPVHNAYLQAATELAGVIAMLVLITMLLALLTQLWWLARREGGLHEPLARPAVLSVAALMLLMLGEPMLDHSNTWLCLGLYQCIVLLHPLSRGDTS